VQFHKGYRSWTLKFESKITLFEFSLIRIAL